MFLYPEIISEMELELLCGVLLMETGTLNHLVCTPTGELLATRPTSMELRAISQLPDSITFSQ